MAVSGSTINMKVRINKSFERWKVPKRNKEKISAFLEHLKSEGRTTNRISKYLYQLCLLSSIIGSFTKIKKEKQMRKFVAEYIEGNKDWGAWTKHDYKVCIKVFYSWLYRPKKISPDVRWYHESVIWIKTHLGKREQKLPAELYSEDDVLKIINVSSDPQDRCLISLLFDSGARIGEILGIKTKDLQFENEGIRITLNGKTGARKLLLVASEPYIKKWLEYHPCKSDKEACLWQRKVKSKKNKKMDYTLMYNRIKKLVKKTGIKKKANPHQFRHSRATHLAKYLTDAQMNHWFGWVQGSDMPATYIHMSGRDVDKAILRMHGRQSLKCPHCDSDNDVDARVCNNCGKSLMVESALSPQRCPRCKMKDIGADASFCPNCGAPLNVMVALELEDKRESVDTVMKLSFKLDKLKKEIEKYKKQTKK